MRLRWAARLLVSPRWNTHHIGPPIRHHSTVSDQLQQPVQEQSSSSQQQHPLLHLAENQQRVRTLEEMADACRSLLYGKRFQRAENLFSLLLSKSDSHNLDIDLCNVFLEHFLTCKRYPQAKNLVTKISTRADLHTHMLVIRDALQRRDIGSVKRALGAAIAQGLPPQAILGMSGWSREERNALSPLIGFTRSDESFFQEDEDPGITITAPITRPPSTTDVPEIMRVKSQSGGVDLISELSDMFEGMEHRSEHELYRAQLRLEEAAFRASQELEMRKRESCATITGIPSNRDLFLLMQRWTVQVTGWLSNELGCRLDRGLTEKLCDADYFCALLAALPPQKTATIIVNELCSLRGFSGEHGGVKVLGLARSIGKRIREEMMGQVALSRPFLQRLQYPPSMIKKMLLGWEGRKRVEQVVNYTLLKYKERQIEQSMETWLPEWSTSKSVQLGSWLLSGALSCIDFKENAQDKLKPFYHSIIFDPKAGHRLGIVRPCRQLLDILLKRPGSPASLALSDPWALPMLVPPRPWLTFMSGGYLSRGTPFVRLRDEPVHEEVIRSADAQGLMDTVKRGLDVLGLTAWRINKRILNLQIELWNEGFDPRTLELFPDYTLDPRPKSKDYPNGQEYIKARQQWQRQAQLFAEQLSCKCDSNYKLEIARMFSRADRFYLPHSVDFRGRAYTLPPHLSHISSDPARGLLVFSNGVKLGQKGLFWLKVHLANMYGFDKASLAERASFIDGKLEQVFQSAKSPRSSTFWKEAEEPWQCLAACMELHEALTCPQGPDEFVSHLPVQQDGSCNGLQHYAALGGDPEGASKVNLSPSTHPQDVYRSVADLVSRRLEEDLSNQATPQEDRKIAEQLKGKVSRKIVKTTVMTNVYGVTEYGAREQLSSRMREAGLFLDDDASMVAARAYLAKLVFASLKELFVQAKHIQDWLTAAAEEIVHALPEESAGVFGYKATKEIKAELYLNYNYRRPSLDESAESDLKTKLLTRYPQTMVSWTTPLKFIVIQPYSKPRTVSLLTALQRVNIRTPGPADPIDPLKQAAAFPPNYIHSLDASHMFMTALASHEAGISFASVHDCFWTHAGSVDIMSRIIREQFVKLYSEPVLERLREEFLTRYKGYKVPVRLNKGAFGPTSGWRPIYFPPVPKRGPFDLSLVLKSDYFFS